ncbi:diiron oxygenase [Wocania ichthyoenteri]|uniref:diiron oxygenase n=1 Tax=Wocania ichthyoenteri TaxID=1230531 RepID=UPI00138DF59D|nr:diiron oxygenase [Wocania ichthyoenteri]
MSHENINIDFDLSKLGISHLDYTSKLKDWYDKSSVRSLDRRIIKKEELDGKLFYSPELVPISTHPIIVNKGLQQEVLYFHLISYLEFTNKLEHNLVNRVTQKIAQNEYFYVLPDNMRLDAYKIYCDESYHALFSEDILQQLEQLSSVNFRMPKTGLRFDPSFLSEYNTIADNKRGKELDLIETFFVITTETLITKTLVKVPKDTRVLTTIRQIIGDHAKDEAFHHNYFSQLLKILWKLLSVYEKAYIIDMMPDFIRIFSTPDLQAYKHGLSCIGLSKTEIEQIIEESHPQVYLDKIIKQQTKSTVRLFQKAGVSADYLFKFKNRKS